MNLHPATEMCNILEMAAIQHGIADYRICVYKIGVRYAGYLLWDAINITDIENPITVCITLDTAEHCQKDKLFEDWKWSTEMRLKRDLYDFKDVHGDYQ